MAGEYKGLTIEFNGDTTKLTSALRKARSEATGTSTELKLLNQGLKLDPSNVTLLSQKQTALQQKIKACTSELNLYQQAQTKVEKGSQQWTKLESDITLTKQKLASLKSELNEVRVAQNALNSGLGKVGTKLTELGEKTEAASQKLGSIGSTLTKTVTVGLAAAGTASVVAATKIDTSLTNVKKTVDGTAEDYQKLKDSAIEFSKTNAVSASTILDVESLGAQLGYTLELMDNGKSQVQEFGEVVSGLDIATNMDAETAGSELAQFFNIMQLGKEQTENYASAIVDLGNKNATTESSISAMALRIAGAGKQIGLSGADVLGLATALSSLGIEAEMGGTAISTIMSNIDKAVALNNDNLQTWAETAGMSAEEFSAAWKNNAVNALNQVLTGMQSAVDAGGNMSVMLDDLGISSLRQTDVMKRLAGGGETLSKAIETANTAWEENVALDNEVENRNNSLSAKFEMLKNRVVAVAEEIGRPLADAMLEAIDAAQPLFTAIENGAKAFSEMSEDEQKAVLACAGLITALGPVLSIAGKASTAFKGLGSICTSISQHFAQLNIDANAYTRSQSSMIGPLQQATTAQKAQTVAMNATSTASKALKAALAGIGIGLVVAAITSLVSGLTQLHDKMKKNQERADNLKYAQVNLAKSTEQVEQAAQSADSQIQQSSISYDDLRDSIDESITSLADFTKEQEQTWGQLNSQSAYVGTLTDEIAQLADKERLTASEQAKLSQKVQEYNSITGSTIEVIDGTTGQLSVSTEELKKNTEAWKLNAEAQALQNRYTSLLEQRYSLEENYNNALAEQQKAEESLQKLRDNRADPLTIQTQEQNVRDFTQATKEAKQALDTVDSSLQATAEKQVEVTNQTFLASNEFANLSSQLSMSTQDLQNLCTQYGITGQSAITQFVEGIKSGQPTAISAGAVVSGKTLDEFKALVDKYKITGDENIKKFAEGIGNGTSARVAAEKVADEAKKGVSYNQSSFTTAGKNAGLGFAQGLSLKQVVDQSTENAKNLANKTLAELQGQLVIHSPSKKTEELGRYFSEGFAIGISKETKEAVKKANTLGQSTLQALEGSTSDFSGVQLNPTASLSALQGNSNANTFNIALNYKAGDTAKDMFNDLVGRLETLKRIEG